MNVMIDLETMSSDPNAAILSIGAVHFDNVDVGGHEFYVAIKPESAALYGAISATTMQWWMQQSQEARDAWNDLGAVNFDIALLRFSEWFNSWNGAKNQFIWANGPDFDCVILAHAFRKIGVKIPWAFRNHRCFRTLKGFFHNDLIKELYTKYEAQDEGAKHNALYDARLQAKITIDLLQRVQIK